MVTDALVGRALPTADLRRAIDEAAGGRGRLVLLAGEAGIGKTTLAAETAGYAAGRGLKVLWATCWEGDGVPAYWPWVQVVRAGLGSGGAADLLGPGAADVARIVPEVAGESATPAQESGDPEQARFRLFDAVASFLLRMARVEPLLVVLDDLHWADAPSLRLLAFLARRLPTAPVLVLGAFRDVETGPGHPLRAVVPSGELVALAGLPEAEVAELMASVAGRSVTGTLAGTVARRTGGNPFFVRELTQLLVSRGEFGLWAGTGGPVPDGVRDVIGQRLARLPGPCVELLTVAAAAGPESGSDLLARVSARPVAEVAGLLDQAVRAKVLAPPPGPSGPWRFAHDLFRETLYDGVPAWTRAGLHLRLAEALDEQPGRLAAELARHFLLAAAGGATSDGRALHWCRLAAAEASERLAFEDAAGLYRRALDGLGLAGLLGQADRLELLLGLAGATRRAGDLDAARAGYDEAAGLARQSGDAEGLARAALGIHALGVETGASHEAPLALLEEALTGLAGDDSALEAEVTASVARELYHDRTDFERARELGARAVAVARTTGDDPTLAVCLLARHDTIWVPGTARERRAIAAEMAEVAGRAGNAELRAEAVLLLATAEFELGQAEAVADLEEFIRLAEATRQPRLGYLALSRRAGLALLAGRLDEAGRVLEEADELGRAIGEPDARNVGNRGLWELRTLQGRRAELADVVGGFGMFRLQFNWYRAEHALALLAAGDRAGAERIAAPALAAGPGGIVFDNITMIGWASMSEVAAALGDRAACLAFTDALAPLSGTAVVTAGAVCFNGAVDHHLGVLALALGRAAEAVELLERAADLHERLGSLPWLARTWCELATALQARNSPGDRDRAAALLDQVEAMAAEHGLGDAAARAARLRAGPERVFRREGEVWLLAWDGDELRLKPSKGLADLAVLLAAQGRQVPATTLVAAASGDRGPGPGAFGADAVLDPEARRAYKARLDEIEAEVAGAERAGDQERAAAAEQERDFLLRELKAAVGLGGRARGLGDDAERARKAVTARIGDSLARIEAVLPDLGAHLRASVTTGTLCGYLPSEPVVWRL
jgi:tetratricopeptide (TPR) repeat protein